ncbi:transcriptional regulator, TetR family [Leifsonia xyli subsp. xyli str. CTCB07]|uniref:Transcriptional regulator, TetR family n=1 Tax=Leifsonia xyli subsp. xyli (strain CTCB07) TaxID=281090 RepID=Q6AGT2_LEIXX|nr:TetR family transcriptional regulator [Leifsonia xyli]AAT88413.1 transcriptional regulator, TetR family [Leifsonia xyli subsp. xyli str. CTCB07]
MTAAPEPVVEGELGLREHKRIATRRAIQLAAIQLASERGFDRVTVDEISHAANVSPRTFFNYFPSKEPAIVGELPELPDEASIDRFVAAGPEESLLEGIGQLLIAAITTGELGDPALPGAMSASVQELHIRRRALLKDNPELFAQRLASMHQFEDVLSVVVQRRLSCDDLALAAGPEALNQRARLVTYVAFAGIAARLVLLDRPRWRRTAQRPAPQLFRAGADARDAAPLTPGRPPSLSRGPLGIG